MKRKRTVRQRVVRAMRVPQMKIHNRLILGIVDVHIYTSHQIYTLSTLLTLFHRVYDPRDYDHLQVSVEVKELFRHITRYTPQTIELETQLRPFIPEYIPAIGDIDAFLKVKPHPNPP